MKVYIAGAGIAGLSAALGLLRKGHQVTLFEKQKGPIDRVCGEGILPFGVELLKQLGLKDQVRRAGRPFAGIAYFGNGQQVMGEFEDGSFGIGIGRGQLDALLREACLSFSRFHLREGETFRPEPASGRRIFAADGIHSKLGTYFGKRTRLGNRMGVRFRLMLTENGLGSREGFKSQQCETRLLGDRVRVHFFKECEVYLTPVGPHTLSVALLLDRNKITVPGKDLTQWCIGFFRSRFPEFQEAEPQDVKARAPISSKIKGPNPPIHLLGDALCAFDPISGAGMSFALLCAKWAAEYPCDPAAYYRALRHSRRAVASITQTILFFRGGGLTTRLMMRQLGKAPASFNKILQLHDGKHGLFDLGVTRLLPLLRPW